MTLPYRDFTSFDIASIEGNDPDNNAFNLKTDWTLTQIATLKVGDRSDPWWRYKGFVRPKSALWALVTSLDQILDVNIQCSVSVIENTAPTTTVYFQNWMSNEANPWVAALMQGQQYNGVDDWGAYPPPLGGFGYYQDQTQLTLATGFWNIDHWIWSWKSGVGMQANMGQDAIFRNGFIFKTTSYAPILTPGDDVILSVLMSKIRVRYINAIVNSFSTNNQKLAGGEPLVLTGLGFNNSDADLNAHAVAPVFDWTPIVDEIKFFGNEGQGDYTLTQPADFSVDSDTQITIPAMPAMAEGTYSVRLRKINFKTGTILEVISWSGDFSASGTGLISSGARFTYIVSDTYGFDTPSKPILLTNWTWKNKDGDLASAWYAPIDVSTPDVFYDGRIIGLSPLRRSVDDNTGLFSISDLTIDLANNDKEFSKLLASYFLKNQIVDIYENFANRPFADKMAIHKCIVEDYSLNGNVFSVVLKDITRKYFSVRVPRYICTEAEFANIHDSAKGQGMPELLGNASVTTGTAPGAVEALYVDTVNFEYLAARGSLHSVPEVYSDGILVATPGDYSIVYKDGGRTYIDFVADQGDNRITFNYTGYMYADWNSANGYVQNPIYITAFMLMFIAEIPIELLDIDSFDTLATYFEDEGWDESGHLMLTQETELDETLKQQLFTCGTYGLMGLDGRFKLEILNIEDYDSSTVMIYDQIDLMSPAQRTYNLREAVNLIKAVYDFKVAPNLYYGTLEQRRDSSITDFEAEIEAGSSIQLPWTNSATLVSSRMTDLLMKRGYGDNKINFTVSIQWFEYLDVLTIFQFQDPFGLSATGAGEVGRYYYITSLSYNWVGGTIDVEAVDLQWLLRQYFIFGDEDEQEELWLNAGESDRIFGYLADEDTGEFQDGEPGKIL